MERPRGRGNLEAGRHDRFPHSIVHALEFCDPSRPVLFHHPAVRKRRVVGGVVDGTVDRPAFARGRDQPIGAYGEDCLEDDGQALKRIGYGSDEFDPQYDVSLDDQRFLMIIRDEPDVASAIVVVTNWFEELKEQLGN